MHMRLPCFPVLLLNCALSAVFQHHNNNSPAWLSTVCSGALVSVVTAEWCHIIQRGGGARLCCREHSMVRHRYFCTIKVSVSFVILKSPHMHTHCQWYSLLKSLYIMIEKSNENITKTFETQHTQTRTEIYIIFATCKLDSISLFYKQMNTQKADTQIEARYFPAQLTYIYRLPSKPKHLICLP